MHYVDELIDGERTFSIALYPLAVAHNNAHQWMRLWISLLLLALVQENGSRSLVTRSHFLEHFWKRFVSLMFGNHLDMEMCFTYFPWVFFIYKNRETNRSSQPRLLASFHLTRQKVTCTEILATLDLSSSAGSKFLKVSVAFYTKYFKSLL